MDGQTARMILSFFLVLAWEPVRESSMDIA